MKKIVYSNKVRYFAIVLVCVFALMAAAGYTVAGLSWWWDRHKAEPHVEARIEATDKNEAPEEPADGYTAKVLDDTVAIVLNTSDNLFYYETALGFIPVERLVAEAEVWDGGVEEFSYSLNTSGGSSRYVRDEDKSKTLDVNTLSGIFSVALETGEKFLLNAPLIEDYSLNQGYSTDYVYYTRDIMPEEAMTPAQYYEKKYGTQDIVEEEAPKELPQKPVTDEEKLYRYVEAVAAESGMDLPIAVACTVVGMIIAVFVVMSAGHFGSEEIHLTCFDRCGFSLLFIALAAIGAVSILPADIAFEMYRFKKPGMLIGFAAFALLMCVLCTGWLIESIAVRLKAKCFWKTTTVYYIFEALRKPIIDLYLKVKNEIMTYNESKNGIGQIIDETAMIVSGERDSVSTMGVYRRYHPLVNSINAIAQGKSNAVSDKLKSDRMRTELITNVSHDIKTPLTSIISYVELLDKEGADSEKSAEYVKVLKRQSLRLKTLLEDLIEASKASTGVLPVNKEDVRLGVIVNQVLAEYDERLNAKKLNVVVNIPEDEKPVSTDGRHLSRAIGNLLSNITKYSLEGTRVYIDVAYPGNGANACMTFKNTSASQLNISSEELMERFVRGDESRKTEGSGLGLSIAGSLIKMLGGELQIDIDGDLFKAKVTL